MLDPKAPPGDWITLSHAAQRLGVHPATLRRWADDGQVPTLLTPGGHRRFRQSDIDEFAVQHGQLQQTVPEDQWAGEALTRVRRAVQESEGKWWAGFTPAERDEYRGLGRRLMGVAMHYIADSAASEELMEEARSIGEAQARLARRHGHSLTEAMSAALFFRDALLEVAFQLPSRTRLNHDAHAQLLRRINGLLNVVQIAIGEVYERQEARS